MLLDTVEGGQIVANLLLLRAAWSFEFDCVVFDADDVLLEAVVAGPEEACILLRDWKGVGDDCVGFPSEGGFLG